MLGVALAAGPANTPVTTAVVNDVNPAAREIAPAKQFSTYMDPPETVWTRAVATTYSVGVTPVQDTLMWVSCGQTELRIYVFNIKDPSRPLIDSFPETGGPSGWGIRDMAWKASTNEVFAGYDNQAFHVYDATTHIPNHTYTVSGYSGTVRGMGYSPVQDSCWTCNFASSPMTKFSIAGANGHQVKAAAEMASAYGIAWDGLQNCFWVSMAGIAGASPTWKMNPDYTIADSFLQPGFDLAGGIEMWKDTFLLTMEQGTPDVVWCHKFNLGPPPDHDVGVNGIIAPAGNINPGAVTPEAKVKNFGGNPESNIPVTCWIDSGATRVYSANATLPGPLGAGAEANVTFTPNWNPGPAGAQYNVTMFTALVGDINPANDTTTGTTTVTGAVFSDTIIVKRLAYYGPTIDGVISPGEWSASNMYDISDILGRAGTPWPAGSNIAYYLYDFAEGFMYYAMDCPNYSGRIDYDQFGPYMDENNNHLWATDSSEGNHWVEIVGGLDDVQYRALLSTLPDVWLMGVCPGAVSVSSTTSGHLQFETKIPIGTDKWEYRINPGDTVGYFQYTAVGGGSSYIGWWPQSQTMANWANPQYYGMMVFDPTSVGVEAPQPGSQFALYKASPSLVRDYANISYYVGRQANVELGVYDATGSLVKTLASGTVTPGERTARWNRTDNSGNRVANGTYFYRLVVDGDAVSGKAVVLK
jgi:hypothetical protein